MPVRRLRKEPAHLEITAFINLIVVLVPFLLSTAVFSRLAVMDLNLPAQSSGALEQLDANNLQLEVVIRADAVEVGDRVGGLIQRIANVAGPNGGPFGPDLRALSNLMHELKRRFPDKTEATVLAEPATSYDTLVHVMDAVRAGNTRSGTRVVPVDLFPSISVGDAPVRVTR